jgi:hypothetical protein
MDRFTAARRAARPGARDFDAADISHHYNRGPMNPILERTPYRSDNDREGSTLDYIDAKIAVVAHGGEYGTNPMTAEAARRYTFRIVGPGISYDDYNFPNPKGALRLAYFMRECGHDVRCELQKQRNEIWLWVAEGPFGDEKLYWVQGVGSHEVLSAGEMRETMRAVMGPRFADFAARAGHFGAPTFGRGTTSSEQIAPLAAGNRSSSPGSFATIN